MEKHKNLFKGYNKDTGWHIGFYEERYMPIGNNKLGYKTHQINFQLNNGKCLYEDVDPNSVCRYIESYPVEKDGEKKMCHIFSGDIVRISPEDDTDREDTYETVVDDNGFVDAPFWVEYEKVSFDDLVWSGGYGLTFEVVGHSYDTEKCEVGGSPVSSIVIKNKDNVFDYLNGE